MVCKNCGANIPNGELFCPNCGTCTENAKFCKYCGAVIAAAEYDWVISAIKGISQRTS